MSCLPLYLGTVPECGMSCLSLYLGTVLKVWYVLFIIIFTFRTVPKYNEKQDIPHHHNSS